VVAFAESRVYEPADRSSIRWWRLPVAIPFVACVTVIDNLWKQAAVASGHSALDAPASIIRPALTLAVLVLALFGVLVLPRLCMVGALLVLSGVSSNIVSLGVWTAVPNPLGVHIGGGTLRFCLADTLVWSGSMLFLGAVLATLLRMPDDRFAELVGRSSA
jgi:hypothetical protein